MRAGLIALALLTSACGKAGPCQPGGDGKYLDAAYTTLDQYCLVSLDAGQVEYPAGVVPYDLNTTLFSDYMIKERAVFIPKGKSATYDPAAAFDFPLGTVLIKTFGAADDLRKAAPAVRIIETRLLVKAADGWRAYPYVWDAVEKTATYAPGGRTVHVSQLDSAGAAREFDYLVPEQTQCKQCHEDAAALTPIGPKARNLNRDFAYAEGAENQLAHWTRKAILSGAPSDPATVPKLPVWDDPSTGTSAERARAYLEVNCAHCHSAGGAASTSGLFLWASETDPLRYGVCKEPLSAGPGAGGLTWDVVPGDPDHSIVWYRMSSAAAGVSMPQIGRSLVHAEAVALVREWITGLPAGPCNH